MPRSARGPRGNGSSIQRHTLDLCWGAWSELGVSGWARSHDRWAIDPEPLVVFTMGVVDAKDLRLRDEVTDWCIRYWRHLSTVRLRHILTQYTDDVLDRWGSFAATVNKRSGANWPSATQQRVSYKTTGRSTLRSLEEPSLLLLRMRAIFGISARTEILRCLRFNAGQRVTAAVLAELTNYTKRNVAESCDLLVQAGALSVREVRNRRYFSLANPGPLSLMIHPIPDVVIDWNALLRTVTTIQHIADISSTMAADALVVEVHQAIRDIEDDLDLLDLSAPRRLRGAAVIEAWDSWAEELMADVGAGVWLPADGAEPATTRSPSV